MSGQTLFAWERREVFKMRVKKREEKRAGKQSKKIGLRKGPESGESKGILQEMARAVMRREVTCGSVL